MIRPIYDLLGHVVHARFEMEGIKAAVLDEMAHGYRPTHRGVEWDREMFLILESAGVTLEVCFSLLKALQFPEAAAKRARLMDAHAQLSALPLPHPEPRPVLDTSGPTSSG